MIQLEAADAVQNVDLIENGAWLHLRGIPAPGEDEGALLYLKGKDGKPDQTKPFRMLVRSSRSKYFRQRDLRIQTVASSKAQRAPQKEQPAVIEKSIAEERPQRFSFLVASIENASQSQAGVIQPSEAELMDMAKHGPYQFVVDQVMRFAFDDKHFGDPTAVADYGDEDEDAAGNAGAGAVAEKPTPARIAAET